MLPCPGTDRLRQLVGQDPSVHWRKATAAEPNREAALMVKIFINCDGAINILIFFHPPRRVSLFNFTLVINCINYDKVFWIAYKLNNLVIKF